MYAKTLIHFSLPYSLKLTDSIPRTSELLCVLLQVITASYPLFHFFFFVIFTILILTGQTDKINVQILV
jgi:hypothetical protein